MTIVPLYWLEYHRFSTFFKSLSFAAAYFERIIPWHVWLDANKQTFHSKDK